MNIEKIKKYLPWVWVASPCIAGIIVLICGLVNVHTPVKVLMIICSVLLFALGVLNFIYFFAFGERRRNYFLTDRETGRNKRISELTFADVNDRMNFFMAKRINDVGELWTGGFLGKRGMFGVGDVFKPLAIYKMLFDMGEQNTYEGWHMFYDMPDPDFARMVNCLDAVDDVNMSRKLTALRRVNDGTQTDRLADFIKGNNKYIQNRMVAYVKLHISEFDEAKK